MIEIATKSVLRKNDRLNTSSIQGRIGMLQKRLCQRSLSGSEGLGGAMQKKEGGRGSGESHDVWGELNLQHPLTGWDPALRRKLQAWTPSSQTADRNTVTACEGCSLSVGSWRVPHLEELAPHRGPGTCVWRFSSAGMPNIRESPSFPKR